MKNYGSSVVHLRCFGPLNSKERAEVSPPSARITPSISVSNHPVFLSSSPSRLVNKKAACAVRTMNLPLPKFATLMQRSCNAQISADCPDFSFTLLLSSKRSGISKLAGNQYPR